MQVPHLVGPVMDPVAPTTETKEPITVTPTEIIYHRRLHVLDHAERTGNITQTCRVFGISRKTFYQWKRLAERYGPEALVPKPQRRPSCPTPPPPMCERPGFHDRSGYWVTGSRAGVL